MREKGLQAKPCKTSGSKDPPGGIQKQAGLVLEKTSSRRRLIRGFAAHHQIRICTPRSYPLSQSRPPMPIDSDLSSLALPAASQTSPDPGFGRPLHCRGDELSLVAQPEPPQTGASPSIASSLPPTGVFGRPTRKRRLVVDGRECADEGKLGQGHVQLPAPVAKSGSGLGGINSYAKIGTHFPDYILKALNAPIASSRHVRDTAAEPGSIAMI